MIHTAHLKVQLRSLDISNIHVESVSLRLS